MLKIAVFFSPGDSPVLSDDVEIGKRKLVHHTSTNFTNITKEDAIWLCLISAWNYYSIASENWIVESKFDQKSNSLVLT